MDTTFRQQLKHFVSTLTIVVMLAACGGEGDGRSGGSGPAPVASPTPAPALAPQGLLTDAQLRSAFDPNAALVDDDSARWFDGNAKIVRSLSFDDDFSDLLFLQEPLQSKRLVMLGESSHGVKEFSQAKVRLIKYLHQHQGFTVLAFEGGLFDCEHAQRAIESALASTAMNRCLFGVWQTQTLRELFDYLVSTQNMPNPLRITGFDVQFSGNAIQERAQRTSDLVGKISPSYAEEILELESAFIDNYKTQA